MARHLGQRWTWFSILTTALLGTSVCAPSDGAIISGSLPFLNLGGGTTAPFTVFDGLSVTSGTTLDFTITYNELAADTDPGDPTEGIFNAITQAVLTIGGSSVTLNPGATTSDFDPTASAIRVENRLGLDRLIIDIRAPANLVTFGQDSLIIELIGPDTLFSTDGIDPLGGATTLDLSDFTGANTARIDATTIVPFVVKEANYAVDLGTITFPNSTPTGPPNPPGGGVIPEMSSVVVWGLLTFVGLGSVWMRRREAA